MSQSITVVTIGVDDVDRSRRFYSEGLGWTPVLDLPEVVFYQVNFGLLLGLWGKDDLSADVGASLTKGSTFSLAQNLDSPAEVDAVIDQARAAGATIMKEPQHAPIFNGYQGIFTDPDGYLWDIVYNPGLSVKEDGTVVFGS